MYNGKVLSLGRVLWTVMRHPMARELSYDEAAGFALEFIRLVNAPLSFEDRISKPLKLNYYKARLPDDLLNIKGVKYHLNYCSTDTLGVDSGIAMIYATDVYHKGLQPTLPKSPYTKYEGQDRLQGYTYMISKNIITTSIEEGYVTVSYKSLMNDEDGFPLVPDTEPFKLGMEYYILFRFLEPIWLGGKIPNDKFNYIEQKKHWYLASAQNSLQMPTMDQMESILNGISRIITTTNAQTKFFRNYGVQERIKTHH